MASFFCHGCGVTKQVRLERIVRHHTRMPNQMTVSVAADTMSVRDFGQNVPSWTWLAEWSGCCRSYATLAGMAATADGADREGGEWGKSVTVRINIGGCR